VKYTYHCDRHGEFDSPVRADEAQCPMAPHMARRVWAFQMDRPLEPYWSPSFGCVIKSKQHAMDLAKIKSEEQTLRTGIPHDYVVVETHDDEAVGIDTAQKEDILEDTRRHAVNSAAWSNERLMEVATKKAERKAKKAEARAKREAAKLKEPA
jgi:hypothetical protein